MRKLHKLFSFIFLFFLFSCYSSRILTEVLKVIETEDNNLCNMQGTEFKNKNTKVIYWECRLRVINQRISGEFDNYGYSLLYKREFKRLKRIIKNRIKDEKANIIAEINNSVDEKEHSYCLLLKNKYTATQSYDYFKCREDLEKIRKSNGDFSDLNNEYVMEALDFQEYDLDSYDNITYIDSQCIKYAKNQEKLSQCLADTNNRKTCIKDIDNTILQRRIDDRIYCTKLSNNKYPDSLSTFTDSTNTDSFGPKMNKLDLVSLRAKEFDKCYKERNSKIMKYREYLKSKCKFNTLE